MRHFKKLVILTILCSLFINEVGGLYVENCGGREDVLDIVRLGEVVFINFVESLKKVVDIACLVSKLGCTKSQENTEEKNKTKDRKDEIYLFILLNLGFVSILFTQVFLGFCFIRFLRDRHLFYVFLLFLILPLLFAKFCYYTPRSTIDDCSIIMRFG
ncbi:MAG: hypothetical protein RMJ13_03625 [Elusimicrobiota bacterium]|nr:hypothetical protein [Elusimicrobiota bacterium]